MWEQSVTEVTPGALEDLPSRTENYLPQRGINCQSEVLQNLEM